MPLNMFTSMKGKAMQQTLEAPVFTKPLVIQLDTLFKCRKTGELLRTVEYGTFPGIVTRNPIGEKTMVFNVFVQDGANRRFKYRATRHIGDILNTDLYEQVE